MATTTYVPTPQTDEQPPQAGRNWKTIAGVIALVAMLIGCVVLVFALINENRDEPPQPKPPISNEAQVREQAYKASDPIVRDVFQSREAGQELDPRTVTRGFVDSVEETQSYLRERGLTEKGADKLVSVTPAGYGTSGVGPLRTTMNACFTVGRQLLDKSGKDVRTTPKGEPVTPGMKLSRTYFLVQDSSAATGWALDQTTEGGPC